jgi:hypothetical protein
VGSPELPAAAGAFAGHTETAGDAPDETAAAPAAERKPRRPYTRREKPVDAEEGRAAETTPEPAAD